jgi:hypothetical protein
VLDDGPQWTLKHERRSPAKCVQESQVGKVIFSRSIQVNHRGIGDMSHSPWIRDNLLHLV